MANMSGVSHNIAIEAGESGATAKAGAVLGASSFITKGSTSVTVNAEARHATRSSARRPATAPPGCTAR